MLTPSPSITSAIRNNPSIFFNERKPETIVDTIVIHTMHCIEPECGELFSAEANKLVLDKYQVSAHYIVDREGLIWRLVSDDKRAWHAGVSKLPFADDAREEVNEFSIGVECLATQESGVTDAQYKSLALLCRNISEHYPIRNIVGHSDIAPGRKTDPWGFDWQHFSRALYQTSPGKIFRYAQEILSAHTGTELTLPSIEVVARSAYEYVEMFDLESDGTLKRLLDSDGALVLDCPGSASSFAGQLRNMARRASSKLRVVSADIIYENPPQIIFQTANETAHRLLDPLVEDGNSWESARWMSPTTPFSTPRELLEHRLATYKAYLNDAQDYPEQYVCAALPELNSLEGMKFKLIVSGNLLFAYADQHFGSNEEERFNFHLQSLLRFGQLLDEDGGELRVYPIGTASSPVYQQMERLLSSLRESGYELTFRKVEPFLKAAWDKMAIMRPI